MQWTTTTSWGDIRRSNNARLEMTIADLFVCENFLNQAVESHQFRHVIKGPDFKCRGKERNWALSLLSITKTNTSRTRLPSPSRHYSLDWLSWEMVPLLAELRLPIWLDWVQKLHQRCWPVNNASDHMASGGKKNVEYMSQVFAEKVELYNSDKV